jgi:hypothetical protein
MTGGNLSDNVLHNDNNNEINLRFAIRIMPNNGSTIRKYTDKNPQNLMAQGH